MSTPSRGKFVLRPHDTLLAWEANERQYFRYALKLLPTLELLCDEVRSQWPDQQGKPIHSVNIKYPELSLLIDDRNRTSDSVRAYAAMALEGFLNWYGVLRLGQNIFDIHFERLALVPKLRILLLVCDSLIIEKSDPLVIALEKVAQSRNALVHPKAKEMHNDLLELHRPQSRIPETARESIFNMKLFFSEFAKAIPLAASIVPKVDEA